MSTEDLFEEWRDKSACEFEIKKYPDLRGAWDGPNEDGVSHPLAAQAEDICIRKCKVREICLRRALGNDEAQGIRGGYTFDGGKIPVGKAREIEETMGLKVGSHQSLGRPKKKPDAGKSKYV